MQDAHPTGTTTTTSSTGRREDTLPDRRLRRHSHHDAAALQCPRCGSLNTKFCYYNNYNLSQPRHFCKSCRRYWTNGGVLRNVPVGGGSRKFNKRSKPKPRPEIEANRVKLFDRKVALSNSDLKTGGLAFKESSASAGFEELEELGGGIVLDQTVRIDEVLESRGRDGGLVALDWQANDDQSGGGLFDFTSTVDDDQDYWREATTSFDHLHHRQLLQQWSDLSTYNDSNYD